MNTKFFIALLMVSCVMYGVGTEDIKDIEWSLSKSLSRNGRAGAEDLLKNVEEKEAKCLIFLSENSEGGKEEVGAFYNAVVAYKEAVIAVRNASREMPFNTIVISGLIGALATRIYLWSMSWQ